MADMNLKIKIQGDSKQAEDSVGRVNAALRGLESSSSKLNGLMAGLGVSLSAAGFAAFVKNGIDAADAMNDLADRSGIAIEKLAGLGYAVKIGDTSIESFVSASNKLSINIAKNADDFAKLGISAQDPVDAFKQLADVFSNIEDPQQRAAFGAAALGKSYAEMAPLLMLGADGIQELIDKGREHNPITAEQARLAGEFNDKLEELRNRSSNASIVIAGPLIEALNAFANGIAFANEQMDGFDPLGWLNAGGYGASGKSGQLQYINEQINETSASIEKLKTQGVGGQLADILFGGANGEELNDKLIKLNAARAKLTEADTPKANNPAAATQQQIAAFVQKGNAEEAAARKSVAAARSSNSAEESRLKSINDIIAGLERDIEISSLSENQQRKALDLSNALKNARGGEVQTITDLINAKYNQIEVDKRQSAQWQQLISDANDYADLRKSISDFERSNNISTDSMNGLIGQTQDMLSAGIIDEAQAKEQFDRLGKAYNDGFIEPAKEGTDQLSVYAEQAGRNMQDAFADFLFDPFDKGMDGMLDGFLTTIRRMAANVASAQLMEGLFGKTGSKDGGGLLGPLLGALSSGISGMFGGGLNSDISGLIGNSALFANGGIMTSSGPVPLRKYAAGGVASSPQMAMFGEGSTPEAYVPLPDGRRIPVAMENGGGKQVVNNITLNISTPNADSFRKSERQIRDQMLRAVNV